MGQYYYPVFLAEDGVTIIAWVNGLDYSCSSKLMEQGVDNALVCGIENLLAAGSPYHKARVVWAGDYADNEEGQDLNLYMLCLEKYADKEIKPDLVLSNNYNYILNHTKKVYIDKAQAKAYDRYKCDLHALPFLTCEGNGLGSGDFRGNDPHNIIGSWARDSISAETAPPEDYKPLLFELQED